MANANVNTLQFGSSMTIKELRKFIPIVGKELTVIIQSEPGCGKTSLLAMMAEDNGDEWRKPGDVCPDDKWDYIYVDCPVKDMSDIGMTIPVHATKTLEYYVSSLFCLDSPKPKMILLDEALKAPKLMQIIYTRLMLERMVGDVPLTRGSVIFASSNNVSDGVGDSVMAHVGNRVCIVPMSKPTMNDWLEWAGHPQTMISRIVRAFVGVFPRCLASYKDSGQEDNPYIFKPNNGVVSFVSPRSLAKCDVIVRNRDILGENATRVALAGTIGASAAGDMMAFLSVEKSLASMEEILASPTTVAMPNATAAQLMLMFQAVDTVKTQDELSNFMVFVERMNSSEVQSIFFTMMCRNPKGMKLARYNQKISDWAKTNHELF